MICEEHVSAPAPSLTVEVIRDAIGFHGLRVPWQRLHARASENPFLTWSWIQAAWTRTTPDRMPLLLCAFTGGRELAGVMPLSIRREGLARVCRFLADDTVGSDYLDALVDPEHADAVRQALVGQLMALARTEFDALDLREMLDGSPMVTLLEEQARSGGLSPERVAGYRCPYIAISGDFATYLKGVSRSDNLKRKKKQLEKMPGFAFKVAEGTDAIDAALTEFFRLHAARWASDGGSQGITGPRVEAFHREVVKRFADEQRVRLYTLEVEGKAIASVYMLGSGATRYFYQSGYDPAFAKQSPGLVLLAKTIEDAFTEGAKEYDFLHGSEPYKFEWATSERATVTIAMTIPTLRGRWRVAERTAVKQARALAHGALGERGYETLRRLRRRFAEH
jgi:CelD/BcsL family acetyltransferase involved in cellulose biosynthesis